MHTDLVEKLVARRLRALADEPAEAPYDWAAFQRKRHRAMSARGLSRNRLAAMAAAAVVAVVIAGVAIVRVSHQRAVAVAHVDTGARTSVNGRRGQVAAPGEFGSAQGRQGERDVDRRNAVAAGLMPDHLAQARTRAIEAWLEGLPRDPAVVRVGAHAAVSGLQDQIAALDDLMSAAQAAGARPGRLTALKRQRAQLVGSLAQLRYAEMLASATP
jgi:hypothetical protein